jgi:hypothetical protein
MSKPVSGNSTRVSSLSRHCGRYQHSAPTRRDRNQRQHREAEDTTRRLSGYTAEHLCTLGNSLQAAAVVGHQRPVDIRVIARDTVAPTSTFRYSKRFRCNTRISGALHNAMHLDACTWSLHRLQYLPPGEGGKRRWK